MPSINPATVPSTGLDRWRYVRTGGSALFTAWRTRRRWTQKWRATPLIVRTPNSSARRNCSNSPPFVLLPPPPLPLVQRKEPRQKGGPNSVSKVGRHPIANSASTRWRRRSNPARPYMVRLMTFSRLICPSGAPGQRQGGMYGIAILTKAASEALEAPGFSGRDPAVQLVGQALLDHGRERPGQVDRPGDRRRQLKQHEPAVVLAQLVRLAHQQARCLARGRRVDPGRPGPRPQARRRGFSAAGGGPPVGGAPPAPGTPPPPPPPSAA